MIEPPVKKSPERMFATASKAKERGPALPLRKGAPARGLVPNWHPEILTSAAAATETRSESVIHRSLIVGVVARPRFRFGFGGLYNHVRIRVPPQKAREV